MITQHLEIKYKDLRLGQRFVSVETGKRIIDTSWYVHFHKWDEATIEAFLKKPLRKIKLYNNVEDALFALKKKGVTSALLFNEKNPNGARFVRRPYRADWKLTTVITNEQHEKVTKQMKLSPREYEVAVLLQSGMRNNEIAKKMGISPKTVNTHIVRLFKKAEVPSSKNMYALITTLVNRGLLEE